MEPPTPVIPLFVKEALTFIASNNNMYGHITFKPSEASYNVDKFASIVTRVKISGKKQGHPYSMSVIVKSPRGVQSIELFLAEVRNYKNLEKLVEFQRTRQIPPDMTFKNIPRCYEVICNYETRQYAMILEDLVENGFYNIDKFSPMNPDIIRSILTELGRFHGVSLAIADQQPALFETFEQPTNFILNDLETKPHVLQHYKIAYERAIASIESDSERSMRARFGLAAENTLPIMRRCLLSGNLRVLGHGNLWINNVMFHSKDGKYPIDRVYLIDYQYATVMSPMLDVFSLLFLSTTKSFRDQYLDDMLYVYCESLGSMVLNLGSDATQFCMLQRLQDEVQNVCTANVLLAALRLQVTTGYVDDLRYNYEQRKAGREMPNPYWSSATQDLYKERMSDVLRTADNCGLLTGSRIDPLCLN